MNLFGITIDSLPRDAVLKRARKFFDEPKFHRIATVNPEFLLLAKKDAAFRQSLLNADLRIADGFGIVLVGFLRGERITRFPGADLLEEILRIADERKLSMFLAVYKNGLSSYSEVRAAILKRHPNIRISGRDLDKNEIGDWRLEIGNSAMVLCNFGMPDQELFLATLKDIGVESRLALGVGGSFDYLTGKLRRAPKCLRTLGLEWLWRLILQPKRFRRIWNAVIVFPIKAILSK